MWWDSKEYLGASLPGAALREVSTKYLTAADGAGIIEFQFSSGRLVLYNVAPPPRRRPVSTLDRSCAASMDCTVWNGLKVRETAVEPLLEARGNV